MTKKKETIGVRLNNPGLLKWLEGDPIIPWQGLSKPAVVKTASGWFYSFVDAPSGIRAAARNLINYQDKYKIRTIREIVTKWAPNNENNTQAYINEASRRAGFDPDVTLDLHKSHDLRAVLLAIIWQENAVQPYTDAQIDKALLLAGVEPDITPLSATRTVKGAQVSSFGVVAAGITEAVTEMRNQLEPPVPYAETVKFMFLIVALLGIGLTVYARWDDNRKGLR